MTELKTEEFSDTFTDVSAGASDEYVSEVNIESDLELRLPPEYVPQENERITLYRELDNMERPEQIEDYREHLRDRFGAIPDVTEELIRIVPLRMSARRLGIERIVLKGGVMRIYFVSDDNRAYYNSNAFGRVLAYMQDNPRRCQIKDVIVQGRVTHAMILQDVPTVSEALAVLTAMESENPI